MAFANVTTWVLAQDTNIQIALLLAAALATTIITSYFRTWYRLCHVPGPFLNGWTTLVQLKHVYGGKFHLYLEGLHQKYGTVPPPGPAIYPTSVNSARGN